MNINVNKALGLLKEADAMFSSADYLKSFDLYEEAVDLFEMEDDWENFIEARSRVGRYYIKVTQYDQALYYINETIEIAVLELSPSHDLVGYSYDHIGTCYYYKGVYHTAIEMYNKALQLRLQGLGKFHNMTSRCYTNIGNCYLALDSIPIALHYYQIALDIMKDVMEENHPSFAYTYTAIGACLSSQGRKEECLNYYKRSLSIRLENYGEEHPLSAYSFSDLASGYREIGDNEKSLEYAEKALDIRRKVFGDQQHTSAISYSQLGKIQMELGQDKKGLRNLNKALEIRKSLYGSIHPELASSHEALGDFYFKQKDYQNSSKNYKKEASILTQIYGAKHQSLALNNINLAEIHQAKGHTKRALLNCQKALINLVDEFEDLDFYTNPQLERRDGYVTFLKVLSFKAELFDQLFLETKNIEDISFAQITWSECITIIDKIRNSYLTEHAKLNLSGKVIHVYEKALLNILRYHELEPNELFLEEAFSIAEKGRSSALYSHLKQVEARQTLEIPEELKEKEIHLRTKLTQIDLDIALEKNKKESKDIEKIKNLENEHFDTNQDYEKLIKEFEEKYPNYFDLKYNTHSISVKELQNKFAKLHSLDNACLLEYIIIKGVVYIFLVKKDVYKIIQVPIADDIKDKIQEYNESISFVDFEDFYEVSTLLYSYLVKPVKEDLKGIEKIIIIRDTLLGDLSFDSLINPEVKGSQYNNCQYLIEEYEIAYHYSASLMLNGINRQQVTNVLGNNFMGIAPVDFSGGKDILIESGRGAAKVMRKAGLDGDLQNLPNTEKEVDTVSKIFESKKLSTKKLFYTEATKEKLIEHSQDYKYLLIATHGFSSKEENLSGIFLSQEEENKNSILYTSEVYNLKLNADLVVLSSCSSGIGKEVVGEGMVSLNRGFLFAGASNIIFTQFDIPDHSSSILVELLFKYILEGSSYAEALRKAKLNLIKDEKYSPQDWTGFALLGS